MLQPQRTRATSIAGDRQQLGRALAPAMLPTSTVASGSKQRQRSRYSLLWLYFRRLFKPTQMDFQ